MGIPASGSGQNSSFYSAQPKVGQLCGLPEYSTEYSEYSECIFCFWNCTNHGIIKDKSFEGEKDGS